MEMRLGFLMQTSSPSYLLMSSLDAARAHAQLPATFLEPIQAAALANTQLRTLPGISLLHDRLTPGRVPSSFTHLCPVQAMLLYVKISPLL